MRLLFLAVVAVSSLASLPRPPIAAHATLVSSEPAANSQLAVAPRRIRLVYSEPVEGRLSRVTLVASAGGTIVLKPAADPRDVHAVIAPVDSVAPGRYKVDWRVVSADGHPVNGAYWFAIGDTTLGAPPSPPVTEPPAAAEPEPEPPMEDDVWGPSVSGAPLIPALFRGTGLGALMAVAGMLLLLARAEPNAAQIGDPRVRRAMTVLALAAAAVLAGHVVTWLINTSPEHTFDTAWAASALGTTVGKIELWRTGLAVLALWAWWIARRPRVALVFAAGALAVSGATGHSAAIQPLVAIPAKAIHLLASGVWVGGLAWLVVRPANDTPSLFASDANRVSSLALGAVVAVGLTGVLQTLMFLPSVRDVFTSPYGWIALAKTAGFLVLAAFGAYHRQRVMPRIAAAGEAADGVVLRASVRREILVMVVVILLGGLLAYVPPPEEGSAMSTPTESTS